MSLYTTSYTYTYRAPLFYADCADVQDLLIQLQPLNQAFLILIVSVTNTCSEVHGVKDRAMLEEVEPCKQAKVNMRQMRGAIKR